MALLRTQAKKGLSVFMPIHGDAPYMCEAIQSVGLCGLEEDHEMIFVLDKPTPQVRKQVLGLVSPTTRIIDVSEGGVANAHNEGLLAAQYDLVAIAHCDDVYRPTRLQRQVRFLRENQEVVCVGAQIELTDERNNFLGFGRYPIQPKVINRAMRYKSVIAHPVAMYRRDPAIAVGGYRQDFAPCEDFDLWKRLMKHGQLANLPSVEVKYRRHKKQTSVLSMKRQTRVKSELLLGKTSFRSSNRLSKRVFHLRMERLMAYETLMVFLGNSRIENRFIKSLALGVVITTVFPIRTFFHAYIYAKSPKPKESMVINS